jgi:hypothetical protein
MEDDEEDDDEGNENVKGGARENLGIIRDDEEGDEDDYNSDEVQYIGPLTAK